MTKLNILLVVALLASCLWQVKTAYEARQLFAALDQARVERQQLDAEFKRLDAEAQGQRTNLIVERKAREKLLMRPATPAVTLRVTDTVGQSASSVASAANTATTASTTQAAGN
jgi:cell division protein FtsL